MLTAVQQERFSRHLLLDGFDQDKVGQASFHVRGRGGAALWAARYLAASGCGRLVVDEPAWEDELRRLGPWTDLTGPAAEEIVIEDAGEGAAEGATRGAQAALDALRQVVAR
ncbi:MAG TPA: hypothetical protein VFA79_15690 [Myxococcales bacterium]|nr:hypothetical protein [Myxococcales bacterium]